MFNRPRRMAFPGALLPSNSQALGNSVLPASMSDGLPTGEDESGGIVRLRHRPGGLFGTSSPPIVTASSEEDQTRTPRRSNSRSTRHPRPLSHLDSACRRLRDAVRPPVAEIARACARSARRTVCMIPSLNSPFGGEGLSSRILLTTVYVTQAGDGGGFGTFRILAGNATPGETLIIGASIGTINLQNFFRPIQISDNGLTIVGAGNALVNPHGATLFNINSGANVTFADVSITGGGEVDSTAFAVFNSVSFINSANSVTIDNGANATFTGATFTNDAGLVNNGGFLTVAGSNFNAVTSCIVSTQSGNGSLTLSGDNFQNSSLAAAVSATLSGSTAIIVEGGSTFGVGNSLGALAITAGTDASVTVKNTTFVNDAITTNSPLVGLDGGGTFIFQSDAFNGGTTSNSVVAAKGGANVTINGTTFNGAIVGTQSSPQPLISAPSSTILSMAGDTIENVTTYASPAVSVAGTGTINNSIFNNDTGGIAFASPIQSTADADTFTGVFANAITNSGGPLTANADGFIGVSGSAIVMSGGGNLSAANDLFDNTGSVAVSLAPSAPSTSSNITGAVFVLSPMGFITAMGGNLTVQNTTAANNVISVVGISQFNLNGVASTFTGDTIAGNTSPGNNISAVGGTLTIINTTLQGNISGVGSNPGAAIGSSGGAALRMFDDTINYNTGIGLRLSGSSLNIAEGDRIENTQHGVVLDSTSIALFDHMTMTNVGTGISDVGAPLTVDNSSFDTTSGVGLAITATNAPITVNGTSFTSSVFFAQESGASNKINITGALCLQTSAVPINWTLANGASGTIADASFGNNADGEVVVLGDSTTTLTLNNDGFCNNLITMAGGSQIAAAGGLTTNINNSLLDGNTQPAYVVYVQGSLNMTADQVSVNTSGSAASPVAGTIVDLGSLTMLHVDDSFDTTYGASNIYVGAGGSASIVSSSIAYDTEIGSNFATIVATPGASARLDNDIVYWDGSVIFAGAIKGEYSDIGGSLAGFTMSFDVDPQFFNLIDGNPYLLVFDTSPVKGKGDPAQGGTPGDTTDTVGVS